MSLNACITTASAIPPRLFNIRQSWHHCSSVITKSSNTNMMGEFGDREARPPLNLAETSPSLEPLAEVVNLDGRRQDRKDALMRRLYELEDNMSVRLGMLNRVSPRAAEIGEELLAEMAEWSRFVRGSLGMSDAEWELFCDSKDREEGLL